MEKSKRILQMVDKAIEDLNWDLIMTFYNTQGILDEKGSRSVKKVDKDEIKSKLKNLCEFTVSRKLPEYCYEDWNIFFVDPSDFEDEIEIHQEGNSLGCQLEILFSPARGVSFEKEPIIAVEVEVEEDLNYKEIQIDILTSRLKKSLEVENYELASLLRDKLKEIKEK